MAEGQADRVVLFRLQVVADENSEQQFNALAAAFAETQKKAHQAAAEAARTGAQLQFDAYAASYMQIREQTQRLAINARTMAKTPDWAMAAASERQRSATPAASNAPQRAAAEERTPGKEAIHSKQSLRPEQEKFNERVWELSKHYAEGRISVGEYGKAEEAARGKMAAAIKQQEELAERVRKAEAAASQTAVTPPAPPIAPPPLPQNNPSTRASAEARALDRDAMRIKQSLRTEQEKFNQRVWELSKHYAAGRISVGEYGKAEEAARGKMVAAIKKQEEAVERVRKAEAAVTEKTNKDIAKQERTAATASESHRTHMRAVKVNVSELGEAMLRAGRGVALLGVANEKTTEKIVQGLAKAQAAYDIFKGGIEFWRKATEAMEHFRKGLQATTVASEALTAAETLRAAAGAKAAATSAAGGAAGSAAGGVGSVARGAVSGMAGRLVPGVGLPALGAAALPAAGVAAATSLLAAAAMAFNVGGSRDWTANKMSELAYDKRSGTSWFDPDTFTGWALNLVPGMRVSTLGRVARASGLPGMGMMGEALGRYAGDELTLGESLGFGEDPRERALAGDKKFKLDQLRREGMLAQLDSYRAEAAGPEQERAAQRGMAYQLTAEQRTAENAMLLRREQSAARGGYSDVQADLFRRRPILGPDTTEEERAKYAMDVRRAEEDYATKAKEIDAKVRGQEATAAYYQAKAAADSATERLRSLEQRGRDLKAGGMAGPDQAREEEATKLQQQIASAQQASIETASTLLEKTKERYTIVREAAQVDLDVAERRIQLTKDEISMREQLIASEQGKLRSVKEKFAAMSGPEFAKFSQQFQQIDQTYKSGEQLRAEQVQWLQANRGLIGNDEMLKSAAEGIGAQRMQSMPGYATRDVERVDRLQREASEKKQELEVSLKDARELRVTVDRNDDQLAKRVIQEVTQVMRDRDSLLLEQIKRGVNEELARLRNDLNQKRGALEAAQRQLLQ